MQLLQGFNKAWGVDAALQAWGKCGVNGMPGWQVSAVAPVAADMYQLTVVPASGVTTTGVLTSTPGKLPRCCVLA